MYMQLYMLYVYNIFENSREEDVSDYMFWFI